MISAHSARSAPPFLLSAATALQYRLQSCLPVMGSPETVTRGPWRAPRALSVSLFSASAHWAFGTEERPREIPAFSQETRPSKKSPHLLGLESQLAAAVAGRMPAGRSRCRAHPARLASPPPRRRAARAPSQRLPSPGWRRERPREGSPRAGARDAGTTKVLATAPRPSHHTRRLL